jgi:hypothetical protein
LVDEAAKGAPNGSEQAAGIVKSAIDQASAAVEQLTKATRQAIDTVESQVNKATALFASASEKAAPEAAK